MHKLRKVLHSLESQAALDLLLDKLKQTRTNIEFLMQIAEDDPGRVTPLAYRAGESPGYADGSTRRRSNIAHLSLPPISPTAQVLALAPHFHLQPEWSTLEAVGIADIVMAIMPKVGVQEVGMRRRRESSDAPRFESIGRGRLRARRRERTLLYRAPLRMLALLLGVVAALTTAAIATKYLLAGAVVVGTAVLAWLALALRASHLEPAGPRGDGPTPPGGAGVREPRRPLPFAPAGAAAMSLPEEEEPPRRAVALA